MIMYTHIRTHIQAEEKALWQIITQGDGPFNMIVTEEVLFQEHRKSSTL